MKIQLLQVRPGEFGHGEERGRLEWQREGNARLVHPENDIGKAVPLEFKHRPHADGSATVASHNLGAVCPPSPCSRGVREPLQRDVGVFHFIGGEGRNGKVIITRIVRQRLDARPRETTFPNAPRYMARSVLDCNGLKGWKTPEQSLEILDILVVSEWSKMRQVPDGSVVLNGPNFDKMTDGTDRTRMLVCSDR